MQRITWFLVANAGHAFLFKRFAQSAPILFKEIQHPKSREHNHDLVTDREGRSQHAGQQSYSVAMSPQHQPKELEHEHFARELAKLLEESANQHELKELVLIAPPHFLGLLRGFLSPQVEKLVVSSIDKDLAALHINKLSTRLQDL